jgi:NifU-like protein involved in Fe-S cluster formation
MAAGMNGPIYTTEILRLAASIPEPAQLDRVDGTAEERSPACGSSIQVQVQLDSDGRVALLSQKVHACAFGQASAAILAAHARGRTAEEVGTALLELSAWLAGERPDVGSWPGLAALEPARARTGRHGAIVLPFKALMKAMQERRG